MRRLLAPPAETVTSGDVDFVAILDADRGLAGRFDDENPFPVADRPVPDGE
jgi:hypothetical protein